MKAILMAAGMGTRISTKTNEPKSLLDIGNGPLIRHTVTMLLKHNISVCICLGFKGDHIRKALAGLDVTYYENPFYKVTNSIASLWFAKEELRCEEDIILGNADVFWQEDILQILLDSKEDILLLGDQSRCKTGDYFFQCDNGILCSYGKEMPESLRSCEYVGLAKLSSSFLDSFYAQMIKLVSRGDYHLWWENTVYEMIEERPIRVCDIYPHYWSEIDVIEDYENILSYVKKYHLW